MKAIIPVGGRGTRMRPITYSANKHFIPIANKPLIFYPIETVTATGIKQIAITYNPGQLEYAQSILGNGDKWGVKFTYILQPEPKGLANIVEVCKEFVGNEKCVFHLGDNIFTEGIKPIVDKFEKEDWDGLVPMVKHKENTRLGVPYFDDEGNLIKYVEKPSNPPHQMAVPGLYCFTAKAFQAFCGPDKIKPSARGEYEIPDVFQWLINHQFKVGVVEYKGKWLDPGKFNDWLETNKYLLSTEVKTKLNGQLDKQSRVSGEVEILQGSRVLNSSIKGPVRIGKNVTISDSQIGPYTSIYHGCTIEKTSIGNSVLMRDAKLCSLPKPVYNSIIGPDAEISGNTKAAYTSLFVSELTQIKI